MRLYDICKFQATGYAPDMPTAWAIRAIGGKPQIPKKPNFRTSDGKYIRTSDGKMFNVKEV